jgi:hypothetical protein
MAYDDLLEFSSAKNIYCPDNKKRNSKGVMLIAVIVSVVLIFLLVGMCMLWKIYWKGKTKLYDLNLFPLMHGR